MKQQKIYFKEWMKYHPYTRITATDHYYTNIATKVYQMLHMVFTGNDVFGKEEPMRTAACCITAYFEDVVSQIGIWRAFTSECKKRYGNYLPFYPVKEGDYYQDEINEEDIRFLLWHHIQHTRTKSVVNPENPAIEMVSKTIYKQLSSYYETAPENEELQLFFSHEKRYDSPNDYRELLEWFHYSCYFNAFNFDVLKEMIDLYADIIKDDEHSEEETDKNIDLLHSELCLDSCHNLFALTSSQWLSLIYGPDYLQADLFKEVKSRELTTYHIDWEDKEFIYLTDWATKEKLRIVNPLPPNSTANFASISFITCTLFYYNGEWQQYELYNLYSEKERGEAELHVQEEKQKKQKNDRLRELFMETSNNAPYMYIRKNEEYLAFKKKTVNEEILKESELPESILQEALLVYSDEKGIVILYHGANCIKEPGNPFYNTEIAEREAFYFYTNPEMSSFRIACYLHDHHLLPDAGLNSLKGKEHGQKLVEDNWDFIVRYFLLNHSEKND